MAQTDHQRAVEQLRRELFVVTEQLRGTKQQLAHLQEEHARCAAMKVMHDSHAVIGAAVRGDPMPSMPDAARAGAYFTRDVSEGASRSFPELINAETRLRPDGGFPFRYVPPLDFLPTIFVQQYIDELLIIDKYAQLFHKHHVGDGRNGNQGSLDQEGLRSRAELLEQKNAILESAAAEKDRIIEQLRRQIQAGPTSSGPRATVHAPGSPNASGTAGSASFGRTRRRQLRAATTDAALSGGSPENAPRVRGAPNPAPQVVESTVAAEAVVDSRKTAPHALWKTMRQQPWDSDGDDEEDTGRSRRRDKQKKPTPEPSTSAPAVAHQVAAAAPPPSTRNDSSGAKVADPRSTPPATDAALPMAPVDSRALGLPSMTEMGSAIPANLRQPALLPDYSSAATSAPPSGSGEGTYSDVVGPAPFMQQQQQQPRPGGGLGDRPNPAATTPAVPRFGTASGGLEAADLHEDGYSFLSKPASRAASIAKPTASSTATSDIPSFPIATSGSATPESQVSTAGGALQQPWDLLLAGARAQRESYPPPA